MNPDPKFFRKPTKTLLLLRLFSRIGVKRLSALLIATFVSFLLEPPAWADLSEVREIHYQMGTILDITIWHHDHEGAREILRRSIQEVHRLEGILSNYDPGSSLALLNRRAGQGKTRIPPELFELLSIAADFSAQSGGYFDVTVGPLVDLWRAAGERGLMPDPGMLDRARDLVGYRKLKLYRPGQAELTRKGMTIDLGGIGKGYAVDKVAEILKEAGIQRALVNFGGSSIYALGSPVGEKGWTLGVKGTDGKLKGILLLKDRALSTSGSMGRYWVIDGKRYGHLINPKSGLPVKEARMATVIAKTATGAEALTKPLVLLGEKAMPLVRQFPQVEVLSLSENGEVRLSGGFVSATSFQRIQAP